MSPTMRARLASRGWGGRRTPVGRTQHLPVDPQLPPPAASPVLPPPQQPPAGWYLAPGGGYERWWDGAAWTEHVVPTDADRMTPSAPSP